MLAIEYISIRDGRREKEREREGGEDRNKPTNLEPPDGHTNEQPHSQAANRLASPQGVHAREQRRASKPPPPPPPTTQQSPNHARPRRASATLPYLSPERKRKGKRRGRSEIINLRATRRSRSRACGALGRTRVAT